MKLNKSLIGLICLVIFASCSSFLLLNQKAKPTLYLIGDSTVKNGKGKGDGSLWGWGSYIADHFDAQKIDVKNHALGGTSTRTFLAKGLWDTVLVKLKKGDFVMMQFGHNDSSPLDDTARARGTIKGVGAESKEIFNPITKQKETVYTYGWYLRKFVADAIAKGAIPIICSPIPRNPVKDGKVVLANDSYAKWAEEVAQEGKVYFIPLNQIIKDKYSKLDAATVATFFTEKDHTHTNLEGAKLNATAVVEGLKKLEGCPLVKFLK